MRSQQYRGQTDGRRCVEWSAGIRLWYYGVVWTHMTHCGRDKCHGKQLNGLSERQHHPAIACCSGWSNSRRSSTDRASKISGTVRLPGLFTNTAYSCNPATWLDRRVPSVGASQGKSFQPENEALLKQPSRSLLFWAPRRSLFTCNGGFQASSFHFADKCAAASGQQQRRKLAPLPHFDVHPAVDHAAGPREHARTQQQCSVEKQIFPADLSVASPLFRAPARTVESLWCTTGTCLSSHGIWPSLTYTLLNSERGFNRKENRQNCIQFWGGDGLWNCGGRRGPEKTSELGQREVSPVPRRALASLSPVPVRLRRCITLRTVFRATNAVLAVAERTRPLASSPALPATRQANLSATANERQPSRHGAWSEPASTRKSAVARETVVSRVGLWRVCTVATGIETEAITERGTPPGTQKLSEAVKRAGFANFVRASLATVGEYMGRAGILSTGKSALIKDDQIRAFTTGNTLAASLTPIGLPRRQTATLGFYNAEQQQQLQGQFTAALPISLKWTLSAYYATSSGAAEKTPDVESRTTSTPSQLSKKALKGIQGHPRRFQLMGGRPEFHHVDRNKNGHIVEPTDKFQVVVTTSKNNVHVQVLNKSRAYRTIFGSFAGTHFK